MVRCGPDRTRVRRLAEFADSFCAVVLAYPVVGDLEFGLAVFDRRGMFQGRPNSWLRTSRGDGLEDRSVFFAIMGMRSVDEDAFRRWTDA